MERKIQKIVIRIIFDILTKIPIKEDKERNMIADGIDPRIAYRELYLNLKHQGHPKLAMITKNFVKIIDYLYDLGII